MFYELSKEELMMIIEDLEYCSEVEHDCGGIETQQKRTDLLEKIKSCYEYTESEEM